MVDYDHVPSRRPRHSTSISPVQSTRALVGSAMDIDRPPSPPRPSASRMSLSALVNSPPPRSPPLPPSRSTRQAEALRQQPSRYDYHSGPSAFDNGYPAHSHSRHSDYYGMPPDVGRSYLHRGSSSRRGEIKPTMPAYERSASYERAPSYDERAPSYDERAPSYDERATSYDERDAYVDDYDDDPRDRRLVHSPPPQARAPPSAGARSYDRDHRLHPATRASHSRASAASSRYAYHSPSPPPPPRLAPTPTFQPFEPSGWHGRNGRAASPQLTPPPQQLSSRPPSSIAESDRQRSLSAEPTGPRTGLAPIAITTRRGQSMRPDDTLSANEEVWQEHLRLFQQRREREARDVIGWTPEIGNGAREKPVKVPVKRKGWPADHPTRIAQRQAKEAALAAGIELPKKKYKRKSTAKAAAAASNAIDDELLGLAEGDAVVKSSPAPASSVVDGDDHPREDMPVQDPDSIILPCGLTRAEVIGKVEGGDLSGLCEDDVKQVQDEMWLRKNGPAALRKDGTMRKKPGPAKGWKAMRAAQERAARGEPEPEPEPEAADTSLLNGEADADIAALLDDGSTSTPARKPKQKKKRKSKAAPPEPDDTSKLLDSELEQILPEEEQDELASANGDAAPPPPPPPKKRSKAKEPGVGKGRWTRPSKAEKELNKKAEAIAAGKAQADKVAADVFDSVLGEDGESATPAAKVKVEKAEKPEEPEKPEKPKKPQEPKHIPNTVDPRGVSEAEAKVRLGLVEELQRQAWSSIVRDVPRVYRVNQAYDNAVKQDALRTAQACMRNAFTQRNLKPTYRSSTRANKDATAKAKRVMREMLVYWRKNEKDELAARKRAEKEALEKAKAEEEAREAKRQSRKLNFLLTQTELYSHFIGKKIKTHEAENMDDGAVAPAAPIAPQGAELEGLDSSEPLAELDYDDDDEENLRRHAARSAQAHMQAAKDKARSFDAAREQANGQALDDDTMDGDELNFQNPSMGEDHVTITQPKMLRAQLKEYQLKGLTWLGNLYEQGINGILADEMGLGKTIQSISLLAYLAEVHNLWGPFLVIAPASTLHNWQQELTRFVPNLRVVPYWGGPKDRETLRRIWNRKNQTFNEDSPWHIVVTSYQLAVQDEKYFQMVRWQYMILDEAQAIKSSSSARWKSLLSLNCRNRLLLTGTPIQNSMQELWALLHFIMPSLFDSHEEFSEWFSKDIENAAGGANSALKPEQLKRLHMILKPFMLRRVKKHVQKELGDKIEIDVLVDLSQRQRQLYKSLRQRVPIAELIAQASNDSNDTTSTKSLMNLVMQFRKVCNHPDLFQREDVAMPVMFGSFSQSGNLARQGDLLYCPQSARNAIEIQLPKILWTDGGKLDVPGETSMAGSDTHVLQNLFNIWTTEWINSSLKEDESRFAFLRVMGMSPAEARRQATAHPLIKLLDGAEDSAELVTQGAFTSDRDFAASSSKRYTRPQPRVPSAAPLSSDLPALRDITQRTWNQSPLSRSGVRFAVDSVVAPAVKPSMSNRAFLNNQERLASDSIVRSTLYGVAPSELDDIDACKRLGQLVPGVPPRGLMQASPISQTPISPIRLPAIKKMIIDSSKLARLDELLRELKDGGHRVLLYFQMTKMMDLIEEYLIYRQYKYLRLDGSSPIGERRDMVTSWQTNPDIFVFCLSTRAGGLGINLTAADTVIFYDHDWNPSNDAQAMDRAHRVGQTKQVTVYRLIARGTIEQRIVHLARAKKDVQDIVVGTKSLNDVAKPAEIASLFMDDEELAESVAKRKQAEAHGYSGPAFGQARPAIGDGLGNMDDEDEDNWFSSGKQQNNNDDDDDEAPSGARTPVPSKKRAAKKSASQPAAKRAKKVKIALGPDGLPI